MKHILLLEAVIFYSNIRLLKQVRQNTLQNEVRQLRRLSILLKFDSFLHSVHRINELVSYEFSYSPNNDEIDESAIIRSIINFMESSDPGPDGCYI